MNTISRNSSLLRSIAIVASLATMVVALAGFGSALASSGRTATASKSTAVRIQGFAFKPGTMRVTAGSRVSFSNKDGVAHNATGRGFHTGNIGAGKSKSIVFGHKGTFAYHCTIHPEMHGKVIVD